MEGLEGVAVALVALVTWPLYQAGISAVASWHHNGADAHHTLAVALGSF